MDDPLATSRTTLWTAVKVLAVLVVIELVVRGPFFERRIMMEHETRFDIVRERTSGQAWSVLFDTLARLPRPPVRIGVVGDSTAFSTAGIDERTSIAWLLRDELHRRLHDAAIEVIDCSQVGLYATDAAMIVNALLGRGTDIIVYGVTMRALPYARMERYADHIRSEQSVADLVRLARSGGTGWLLRTMTPSQIADGIAYSTWRTYAYRGQLKQYVWESFVRPVLATAYPTDVINVLAPAPVYTPLQTLPGKGASARYQWTRAEFGRTSENWNALEAIGGLCDRERPARCVWYGGPVNPLSRNTDLAEPGLYDEYLARAEAIAGRHRVLWRDLSDVLAPDQFRAPMFKESVERIHPNPDGGKVIASRLADILAPLIAAVKAEDARDVRAPH